MTAVPGCCWFPPRVSGRSCLPLASSTRIALPMCSTPFNSRALSRADLVENLTKAKPFGLPSGLEIIFMLRMFPHSLNSSLTSPSKALKDRPWTATSNSPCSSSSTLGSSFLATAFFVMSPEAFLLGAGFSSSSSSDSTFFSTFLAAGFFLVGCSSSSSLSDSFFKVFFLGSTLISFEAFLVFGLDYYSDSSSDFQTFLIYFLGAGLIYLEAFLCLGFDYYSDYSDSTGLTGFFAACLGCTAGVVFFGGATISSDYSSELDCFLAICLTCLASFLSLGWTTGVVFFGGETISSDDSSDEVSFFLFF